MPAVRRPLVPAVAVLTAVVALAAPACSDSSDPESAEVDETTTTTVPSEGDDDAASTPVLELLDPGAEPRTELRYTFAPGSSSRFETATVVEQTVDDASPGPISTIVEVLAEVLEPTEGGSAVRITYGTPEVTTAPEALPDVVAAAERSAALLDGAVADLTIDALGFVVDADVQLTEGELADQLRETLLGNLRSQGVVLPAEPVGVGARWVVRTTTDAGGVVLANEQTFVLEGVDATGADLGFTIASTYEAGATGTSVGDGTMRVSFDTFFPELTSSLVNEYTAQGSTVSQQVSQTIRRL